MTLAAVAALLLASPKSWDALNASQKQLIRDNLLPKATGFDGPQRDWFRDWWLAATPAQVTAINAALPARTRVAPVTINSVLYLNIDILTDVIDPGNTYYPARATVAQLVCTNVTYVPPANP